MAGIGTWPAFCRDCLNDAVADEPCANYRTVGVDYELRPDARERTFDTDLRADAEADGCPEPDSLSKACLPPVVTISTVRTT